jgi:hypothetical protein
MKALTETQILEVTRRLKLPQAKHVVAYHMKLPLCQVLAVARSLRTSGRPFDVHGEEAHPVGMHMSDTNIHMSDTKGCVE